MSTTLARTLAAVSLAALALLAGGCNIVGPMGYLVGGDGKQKAAYTLDQTKSIVVFVDDRENLLRDRSLRRVIAQAAEKQLLESKALKEGDVISCEAVESVTAADRWGKPMGIAQVGEAVKADIVIYAVIDAFTLSPEGVALAPQSTLRVKVIDVPTRKRLYPTDEREWHTSQVAVPRRDGAAPRDQGALVKEERLLAERTGRYLAYVFVDHDIVKENRIHGYNPNNE